MTAVTALWLPILLSAVAVFVASSIIHMATPWHAGDYRSVPREDAVADALRGFELPPGDYMLPRSSSMSEMNSPEFKAKMEAGPVAVFTVMPNGQWGMGGQLTQWFVFALVVGLFGGYVAGLALPLPLWDRRSGARGEALAKVEQARWETEAGRRAALRELDLAWAALRAANAQAEALSSRLEADASPALEALEVAWREGELSLLEWLDGIRAWHDAFATLAELQAERLIRQAGLAVAAGRPVAQILMEAR